MIGTEFGSDYQISGTAGVKSSGTSRDGVRIGIAGLGRMGMFHAQVIAQHVPEIEVVAVADTREEVVSLALNLFPTADGRGDSVSLLDDDELQACIVATPTVSHREIVEDALARGLHVFCEKPITLNPHEVTRLAEIASASGLTLQTGFWRRFSPAWKVTRAAIERGAIGTPLFVRSAQWDASLPPLSFCDRSVSGGLFVDCGVHDFDAVEWVIGRQVVAIRSVPMGIACKDVAAVGDVDNGLLILEMESDTVGMIDITRNGGYVDEVRMEVLGTEGSVLLRTERSGSAVLRTKNGVEELTQGSTVPAFELGVMSELRAFALRVQGDDVAVPGGKEDARALLLAYAAWESHDRGGARVSVEQSSASRRGAEVTEGAPS